MSSFAGKSILITGASDGIGAQLARHLAAPGVSLALAARGLQKLEKVAEHCRSRGADALAIRCDVAVENDCKNFIGRAADALGGVDVLVNNAGVSGHAFFDQVQDFSWYET